MLSMRLLALCHPFTRGGVDLGYRGTRRGRGEEKGEKGREIDGGGIPFARTIVASVTRSTPPEVN